ncbi:hypothetical protein BJ508DRAFT_315949 [Ascobolus immersus RN42]|uniref:Uncharacterized protein n=1 Tax=Ascobolus immersus RN42 TaxID=1160509 RepID=A0A3N4HF76_ASCIM|nr:hypothetical protein BJ508DRAFT_315949 [Ascobolus immersus RN42]
MPPRQNPATRAPAITPLGEGSDIGKENTFSFKTPNTARTSTIPESAMINIVKGNLLPPFTISEMESGKKDMITTGVFAPVHYLNPNVWSVEDVEQPGKAFSVESLFVGPRVHPASKFHSRMAFDTKNTSAPTCTSTSEESNVSVSSHPAPYSSSIHPPHHQTTDHRLTYRPIHRVFDAETTRSIHREKFLNTRLPVLGEAITFQKGFDIYFASVLFIVADSDKFIVGQGATGLWVNNELMHLLEQGHVIHGTVSTQGFRHIFTNRIFFDVCFGTATCDRILVMDADSELAAHALQDRKDKWHY